MKKFVACSIVALALVGIMGFAHNASANPTGGSVSGTARVAALGANLHLIMYNAGEQADFAIRGDGDTTLNIIVKDQFGNVVVRTQGPGDRCHVSWTPSRTAVYSIFVINEGGVYNQYTWRGY